MNYELALRLKNAGFPQKGKGGHWIDDNEPKWLPSMPHWEGAVFVPSLSQLINACSKGIKLWANFGEKKESGVQLEAQSLDDVIWYDTPEEAVARLYLQLKSNQ